MTAKTVPGALAAIEALPGLNAEGADGQFRHWKPWDGIERALAAAPEPQGGLQPTPEPPKENDRD